MSMKDEVKFTIRVNTHFKPYIYSNCGNPSLLEPYAPIKRQEVCSFKLYIYYIYNSYYFIQSKGKNIYIIRFHIPSKT